MVKVIKSLKGKKVLVTGAGGFIGSHLVEILVEQDNNVTCFVRYNSRKDTGMLAYLPESVFSQLRIIYGDLRDPFATDKAVKNIDIIFHLGALISIPYSYVHPREVVESNVFGTLNILNSALKQGISRIIHTSTSEVYGTGQYIPIDENHPLQGQSPYSASKIGADKISESFYRSFSLPIVTIRPFNVYGPRQSPRAVIPTIIMQLLSESDIIHLGALHPTRDFTFVKDIVDGFIAAAIADNNINGEVINLGSSFEISIGDLAKKIMKILGIEKDIRTDKNRQRPKDSEVERLFCNNQKANELLKWSPKVSMEEGILRVADWIKDNPQLYKPERYYI